MSAIGYNVGTLGNHEFDNGVGALAEALKFATFPIVSTNYDVRKTALENLVKPYVLRGEWRKCGSDCLDWASVPKV